MSVIETIKNKLFKARSYNPIFEERVMIAYLLGYNEFTSYIRNIGLQDKDSERIIECSAVTRDCILLKGFPYLRISSFDSVSASNMSIKLLSDRILKYMKGDNKLNEKDANKLNAKTGYYAELRNIFDSVINADDEDAKLISNSLNKLLANNHDVEASYKKTLVANKNTVMKMLSPENQKRIKEYLDNTNIKDVKLHERLEISR